MKFAKIFMSCTVVLFLLACSSEPVPIENKVVDFDIETATEMIDEAEWLCAWVQTQESVSRETVDTIISQIENTDIGNEAASLATLSIDNGHWNDSIYDSFEVIKEFIVPTIYHEDIEIVSATEELYEDEEFPYSSSVEIKKAYTGSDENLADWYLTYVFRKSRGSGNWEFISFDGQVNIGATNLELKDSFFDISYISE